MTDTLSPAPVTDRLVVREIRGLAAAEASASLFDAVWAGDGDGAQSTGPQQVSVNIIRALEHGGGYASAAWVGGHMVGALLGFVGFHHRQFVMHSHILGVLPPGRSRGVGFALKQHQRQWSLDRGIGRIVWTFDPLVSRNAYFNLVKLGAVGGRYEINFYGSMADDINAGDETDRMVAVWDLDSPRAVRAATRGTQPPALAEAAPSDAHRWLEVGSAGEPVVHDTDGNARLCCQVPEDIVALRRKDGPLAREWRFALRATLGTAVREEGFTATGMSRSGWYVLERPDGLAASRP